MLVSLGDRETALEVVLGYDAVVVSCTDNVGPTGEVGRGPAEGAQLGRGGDEEVKGGGDGGGEGVDPDLTCDAGSGQEPVRGVHLD